jgi:uncharacterized protein YbjT (DUF2867 family)
MNVVVAGGTGLVGSAIATALLEAGHDVTVISRGGGKDGVDARARSVAGDVTRPDTLAGALAGAEVVVDAVQFPNSPIENPKKGHTFELIDYQGTCNLADAARAAGARQFIGISGAGAAEDGRYHWLRYKWQEEQHIEASGVAYTIFRPTWMFAPGDKSLNRFLNFGNFLPFIPVIGNGRSTTNILDLQDLAAHVTAASGNDAVLGKVFEIGGPEVLTMDQIIRTALEVQGRRRLLVHQPKPLMKALASLVQHAPGRPLTPDAVDFITMDATADNTALLAAFGLPLTPLRAGLSRYLAHS